jgi:RimJ/RimL family protein N-acetyltransferase
MLRFAFHELGLHRIELDVFAFNSRAIGCYEKVGFQPEGTRRQALFHAGTYHDVHLMAMLEEEFSDKEKRDGFCQKSDVEG